MDLPLYRIIYLEVSLGTIPRHDSTVSVVAVLDTILATILNLGSTKTAISRPACSLITHDFEPSVMVLSVPDVTFPESRQPDITTCDGVNSILILEKI